MPKLVSVVVAIVALVGAAGLGLERGWWRLNHPDPREFPTWGIDVSHHQGAVNWPLVATEPHIRFAYLKATEGSDWTDPSFKENWKAAQKAGLRVGAYHFFSFCSAPLAQASHFLSVLPRDPNALPPVVDLEFGGNCGGVPSREALERDLMLFLNEIENSVSTNVVLYVTLDAYDAFLKDGRIHNPLWIRNIWTQPHQPSWVLWQFANRGHIRGIAGAVDLNVLRGASRDIPSTR